MNKYPIYFRFWFFWGILTFLYVSMTVIIFSLHGGDVSTFTEKAFFGLGLFVPIGLGTGFYGLGGLDGVSGLLAGLLSILLIVLALIYSDELSSKWRIRNLFLKSLHNLSILFILTLCVDLLVWNKWISMLLLLGKKIFNFG